jgi:beta-lactamase regulating signal transducer with metallopeptidase domain
MMEMLILAKVTLAAAAGLTAVRLAHRSRASVRHLLLAATMAAFVAIPVAAAIAPSMVFELPVVRHDAPAPTRQSAAPRPSAVEGRVQAASPSTGTSLRLPTLTQVAWTLWAGVALVLLARLGVAFARLHAIRRCGLPWLEGADLVGRLAREAGVSPVELLVHEDIAAPLTCGFSRPCILLPSEAQHWNDSDLRRALVHELEHVRRSDWAIQLAARAACALYWFHPLAWVTWRRLCLEAERACDDAVLETGERTDYAEQLVQLARRLSAGAAQPALGMANRSDLSARVTALLNESQRRGRAGLVRAAGILLAATAVTLAIAPLTAVVVQVDPAEASNQRSGSSGPAEDVEDDDASLTVLDHRLYAAAALGNVARITRLVEAGANVNAVILGDGSPLIAAAREGHFEAARALLGRGANPNVAVPGDGNPLIMAAREGHADIVELLLDQGADIDEIVSGDENALIQASGRGHLEVVKLLVERGADVNQRAWADRAFERPSGEWRTPLSMARRGNHQTVVEFLLSSGAQK